MEIDAASVEAIRIEVSNKQFPGVAASAEADEWAELEADELTGQEIREIAEYLRSTGEASA